MENNIEDTLRQYAESQEATETKKKKRTVVNPDLDSNDSFERAVMSERNASLEDERKMMEEHAKEEAAKRGAGFIDIPLGSLPTRGIFYPDGTKILIKAASGGEIRHWSMTDEEDYSSINEALNYILERCLYIKFPQGTGTWKDCKDIDRLYLILAIRDFTFTSGSNELKVKVSESEEVVVNKDSIDFINLSDKLMKNFNHEKKCFTFSIPKTGKELNLYMPSVGVSQWLNSYIERKSRRNEGIDTDFASIAPLLIKDYRGLNDDVYERYIISCEDFGIYEYSLIAKVKKMIQDSISPKLKYIGEDGAEHTAPLNFRGGFKSLFLLDLDDVL